MKKRIAVSPTAQTISDAILRLKSCVDIRTVRIAVNELEAAINAHEQAIGTKDNEDKS